MHCSKSSLWSILLARADIFFLLSNVLRTFRPLRCSGCVRRRTPIEIYMLLRRYLTRHWYLDLPLWRRLHHLHYHAIHFWCTGRRFNSALTSSSSSTFSCCHNISRDCIFYNRKIILKQFRKDFYFIKLLRLISVNHSYFILSRFITTYVYIENFSYLDAIEDTIIM